MKKYPAVLALMTIILFAFTACNENGDSDSPQTEPELRQEAALNQEPEYVSDGNGETVRVRFYYYSTEIDPFVNMLPEAFQYNTEFALCI